MNNTEYVALQRLVEALTARVEALEGFIEIKWGSNMIVEGPAAGLTVSQAIKRGPGRPKSAAPQA